MILTCDICGCNIIKIDRKAFAKFNYTGYVEYQGVGIGEYLPMPRRNIKCKFFIKEGKQT